MLTVDLDRLGLTKGDRLLDIGCGAGRHAAEGARRGASVVAVDLDGSEVKATAGLLAAMAEAGEADSCALGGALVGDVTRLPFPDGSFDRIIASEVLEHVPDDAAALAELRRVLAPGGRLAVTVPTWFPEQICWLLSDKYHAPYVRGGHVRIYRQAELAGRAKRADLAMVDAHGAHAWHSPYWWLRCMVGPDRPIDDNVFTRAYHRFLVWDLMKAPRPVRAIERGLNPWLGKSRIVYFEGESLDRVAVGPEAARAAA